MFISLSNRIQSLFIRIMLDFRYPFSMDFFLGSMRIMEVFAFASFFGIQSHSVGILYIFGALSYGMTQLSIGLMSEFSLFVRMKRSAATRILVSIPQYREFILGDQILLVN